MDTGAADHEYILRTALGLSQSDVSTFNKFGYNSAVSSTEETIWEQGGRYAWPSSASTMTVSSANANDTSAGTGARTVLIQGLDANYVEAEETITLNGQTEVTTSNSYLRMHRAIVQTAGSGGENAGIIYVGTGTVTAGVPANVYTTIAAGENQTLQCFYTVPANRRLLCTGIYVSTFANNSVYVTWRIRHRTENGVFTTKDKGTVSQDAFYVPIIEAGLIEEKTDIELTGESSGADADMSAAFNFLMIPKLS